ncbi:MAG: ZIP family metal transporter [Nanoarchaeota archaeon]
MHLQFIYILASVFIVSALSLIGVLSFSLKKNVLKKLILYLVSFSAGALLGDAFIHLIPEAFKNATTPFLVSMYIFIGIVFSFIVEQSIHWRHCHTVVSREHPHPFAIMNLVGDAFHNLIDGIIIAGSYLVSIPIGIYTTLAVIFHEIPQEMGDFGVLIYGGFTRNKAILYNFLTALAAVLGALLAFFLSTRIQNLTLFLVPFAAGNFIYIASADLIPEIHKVCGKEKIPTHLVGFVVGIAVMFVLLLVG